VAREKAGRLLAVNVGLPQDVTWHGQTVHTAIWKRPVDGPRQVRRLNIDGDGQGDLAGHGGEHRAVFVYQIESYRYWQGQLGRDDFGYGQFGENFTISGLADDQVCIGDRYQIGEALFEVTQPRVTCYRVGIRMNEARMPALLVSHHRPGFYLRVLREGAVRAGDEIVQVAAGPKAITVAEIDGLLYLPGHSRERVLSALRIPALPDGWKASFRALAGQAEAPGGAAGNAGLTAVSPPPAWPGFRPLAVTAVEPDRSARERPVRPTSCSSRACSSRTASNSNSALPSGGCARKAGARNELDQPTRYARPSGLPARSDWELTTEPVPVPGPREFVVAVSYLSIDPTMRRWIDASYREPVASTA
jgi:MOSC domain-containing protein YiiM